MLGRLATAVALRGGWEDGQRQGGWSRQTQYQLFRRNDLGIDLPLQREQDAVAGDESIRVCRNCEQQKWLVMDVAANWYTSLRGGYRNCFAVRQIFGKNLGLFGGGEREFWILKGGDEFFRCVFRNDGYDSRCCAWLLPRVHDRR